MPWMLLLRKLWPLAVILAFSFIAVLMIREYNSSQREAAASEVIITQQEEVIDATVKTNIARAKVLDRGDTAKYCQCLRTAATASSCERFLPSSEANNSKPASLCEAP